MRKRYNYFDDDEEVIRQIKERRKSQTESSPDESEKDTANGTLHSAAGEARTIAIKAGRAAKRAARAGRDKFILEENKAPRRLAVVLSLVVMVVVIAITLLTVSVSINRGATRDERFNTSAGEICNQYATKYGNCNYEDLAQYGTSGYRLTGVCCVRQIDFNNDNESELLICYRNKSTYYAEVWGFHGKKFDMLYKDTICQSKDKKDDIWVTLYYRDGKYCIGKHDEDDPGKVTLYSLRFNKFQKSGSCTYDSVSAAFTIDKKVNTDDFERIKMAVLRESAAAAATDEVNDTIASMMVKEDATEKKKKSNGMNAAYYSIVKNLNEKYGVAEYHSNPGRAYVGGLAVVQLIDFDNDGTDELLTVYRRSVNEMSEDSDGNYKSETVEKYYGSVYAWNGRVATQVYSCEGLSNSMTNDEDIYYILGKKGKKRTWCVNHFSVENYGRQIEATSKTLSFNGEVFEPDKKAYYKTNYGYTEYYLDDEWSSKSEFSEKGGFDVPFFDGSTTYNGGNYTVTYVQTKASNQNAVKNIVNNTVDTIRRLDENYNPDDVVSLQENE